MTGRGSSDSFKRRKFTITESLDSALKELAAQNYQGNVSLCLRAAIEDHRETLHGTDSGLVAQQLAQRVDQLNARQEHVIDVLNDIQHTVNTDEEENKQTAQQKNVTRDEARILSVIEPAETWVRIEDIDDQLDLPVSQIQPAVGRLLDRGFISSSGDSPCRFQLAGRSPPDIKRP